MSATRPSQLRQPPKKQRTKSASVGGNKLTEGGQHHQIQPTPEYDCTNSDTDPTESVLSGNGKFMQRMLDRIKALHFSKHSLLGGLMRSRALATGHNAAADNPDAQETKPGEAAPDRAPAMKLGPLAKARKRAEAFYTIDTEAYDFKSVLDHYTNNDTRILPKLMKFRMGRDRAPKKRGGAASGGDGVDNDGCVVHPLFDKLVMEFCMRLGMQETSLMPSGSERMFLWLSRDRAQSMIGDLSSKDGSQMFFLNRINLDHVLTDLQCLCTRLGGCVAREGQVYPPHCCTDANKIREQHRSADPTPPPMAFVDKQFLCRHVYHGQDFGLACQDKECPNFGKRLCECFQTDMFIPDTVILATKKKFEEMRDNLDQKIYGDQRWLIRASNLKGGNGAQLIDTASELETFLRYDLRRRLRGQFFVIQRLLKNPMLLESKRFDLRMFLLISVLTDRRVVAFLHPGYIRLAQKEFDLVSNDLRCHLTWPFTWDPEYNRYKEADAAKDKEPPADYCRPYSEACEALGLPKIACDVPSLDASLRPGSDNRFLLRLGRIVRSMAMQMDSLVGDKPGTWQLFGLDLIVDADKEVWLHDVMSYPCKGEPDIRSDTQNRLLPAVLTESLALVLELNQRDHVTRGLKQWLDLPDVPFNLPGLIAAQKNFVWMYSTDPDRLTSCKSSRKRSKTPHWYKKWRVTEDFNDYILYLKNYRYSHFQPLDSDTTIYGRKSFDHSSAEKFRQMMKSSGKSNDQEVAAPAAAAAPAPAESTGAN